MFDPITDQSNQIRERERKQLYPRTTSGPPPAFNTSSTQLCSVYLTTGRDLGEMEYKVPITQNTTHSLLGKGSLAEKQVQKEEPDHYLCIHFVDTIVSSYWKTYTAPSEY